MAGNSTVAAMTAASALSGSELFYVNQGGNDRKATATQIQTFIGSGITIGTTAITGGTTTRILYDNAGVVGEYTLSGSGTVVAMATSPSFTTPALGVATATSVTASGLLQAGTTLGISTDVLLQRDAANIFGQRNSTTAQTFRVYNTFTDASNYERCVMDWTTSANNLILGSQNAGTGQARGLFLTSSGDLSLCSGGTNARWVVPQTAGHFLAGTDNTYDIGASGASRPRTLYVGTSVITPALRIDQAPTANSSAATTITNGADSSSNCGHRIQINMNGTTYWIPCSSVAF